MNFCFGRYKMGIYKAGDTCPDPPPPQDSPPPQSSSHSKDKRSASGKCSSQSATSRQLLQKLYFSNELEVTQHEASTKDGKRRVCDDQGNA